MPRRVIADLGYVLVVEGEMIVAASEGFAGLFGYEPADLVGRPAWSLVRASEKRRRRVRAATRRPGSELNEVATAVHRDGHEFQLAYTVREMNGYHVLVGEPIETAYYELDLDSPMLPFLVELLEERALRDRNGGAEVHAGDPWLDKPQASAYTHRSVSTIERAVHDGKLPQGGTPGKAAYRRSWLDQWMLRGAATLLALLAILLALELADMVIPGGDIGFPPGLDHPLGELFDRHDRGAFHRARVGSSRSLHGVRPDRQAPVRPHHLASPRITARHSSA